MKQYFTIGRFQPFTIGHLSMIDENVSEYENISVYIIANSFIPKANHKKATKEQIKNAIEYLESNGQIEMKYSYIHDIISHPFDDEITKQQFSNYNIDVIFVKDAYEAISKYKDIKCEKLYMLCGNDRLETYKKILERQNIADKIDVLIGSGRKNGISGTELRNAIIKDDYKTFCSIIAPKNAYLYNDFLIQYKEYTDYLKKLI